MVAAAARLRVLTGVSILSMSLLSASALADGNAADRAVQDAAAARRAYEADMLARARAEAEERRREMERRSEEEARLATEAAARHAAEEERLIAEAKRRAEQRAKAAEAARLEEEARRAAEARRKEEADAIAAEANRAAEEAKREEEARRLATILEKARAAREAAAAERLKRLAADHLPISPIGRPDPVTPSAPAGPLAAWPAEPTVTVLLVMQPGTRGIRRHHKTADPILCTDQGCHISRGSEEAAELRTGRRALGFLNTWGGRAGACRDQLGCIFRGVRLDGPAARLQPVDMRLVRHDRREAQEVTADSACRIERTALACSRSIAGADYVMWIVPERIAVEAGPARLEAAIAAGLVASSSTADADIWRRR